MGLAHGEAPGPVLSFSETRAASPSTLNFFLVLEAANAILDGLVRFFQTFVLVAEEIARGPDDAFDLVFGDFSLVYRNDSRLLVCGGLILGGTAIDLVGVHPIGRF